jgi:excinuclease ABC subunit C
MTLPDTADGFDPQAFIETLTRRPGVYRMIAAGGEVLYVGKAKDLKRRVASYFSRAQAGRVQLMVAQIARIEVTVTNTEAEALILENHLIKELKPRFNILLRDDKSYPYLYLSADAFPRLAFHRGARSAKGRYFGPYPSASAVRETLRLLQKVFPVRQCEDSVFRNRSRPCLQHQIHRCTAPCVGLVSEERYAQDVADTALFLEGRAGEVVDALVARMEAHAAQLEFEQAAQLRDRIQALRQVQERQYVSGERGDLDLVACAVKGGMACVQVFYVRAGRNLGNRAFYPRVPAEATEAEVTGAFLAQGYLGREVPAEILVSHAPEDSALIAEALSQQAGRRVRITAQVRGARARWLGLAADNARIALDARLASRSGMRARAEALRDALGLDDVAERLECVDVSHTMGEQTVASCVVFDADGPLTSDYRRYNIKDVTPGDDYAAMAQLLRRRYTRIQAGDGRLPDVLFIDGGKGQLNAARGALDDLGVQGVRLVGVAKGADRRPGMEQLFLSGQEAPLILPADSPALHLIQQLRDEAHRFAITGHRQRRGGKRSASVLEEIPGVGPTRRQRLLKHFGGLRGLARAGADDIAKVDGISGQLARQIYEAFHGDA